MKSGLLTILSVLLWGLVSSQTLVFHENFEPPSGADSVTHYSSSATNTWGLSTTLSAGGTQSDSAIASPFDTLTITSDPFSTTGNGYVVLEFDHICKIEVFDKAIVEVSIDGGNTWTQLDTNHYMGNSTQFGSQGNQFNAVSYGGAWFSGQQVAPDNTWWKHETFNLSTIAADQPDVRVRFSLIDLNGSTIFENYGWFLDNITVIASPSELIPPDISMIPPIVSDTIFSSDPQDVRAVITDDSGIDTAYVVYYVNSVLEDTLGMTEFGPDSFGVQIPFHGFGRSISYFVEAIDLAGAANMATTPTYNYFVKFSDQTELVIGGCTEESFRSPFYVSTTGSSFRYSMHSSIYEASEFNNMGGVIQSIAFNKVNDVGYIHADAEIDIYLKEHPSGQAVSSNSEWQTEAANATLVYSTTTGGINDYTGWQEFMFDTDFTYSGNEPILLLVYWDRPNSATANYPRWCADDLGQAVATTFSSSSFPPSSSYHGHRPQARFGFEAPSVGNDVGVAEITYPTGGVVTGTPFDITVKVKNFGSDTINNFDVIWELDGATQTPYIYSGPSLYPDSLTQDLILGNVTVTPGPHSIKAWTENPNGTPDFNTINDTLEFHFYGCDNLLSGTYNIGGPSADFNTFSEAALGLTQCGIDGPVTFNVAPGVYNEQISLPAINGASAVNTITFQSLSADSTDVVMEYSASGAGDNYVVELDGTEHITFENMSFHALDSTNGRAIVLKNNAGNLSINNNHFVGVTAVDDGNEMALLFSASTLGNNIHISDNAFFNGSMGVHLEAQGSTDVVVQNNQIFNTFARGIRINGANQGVISGNLVDTDSQVESFTGIWMSQGTGNFEIAYNQVYAGQIQHGYGVRVSMSQGDSLQHATVYNNKMLVNRVATTTTLSGGILNMDSRFVDYYYNTVKMTGNDQNSPALIIFDNNPGSSRGLVFKNNIFSNFANGYVLYTNSLDTADVTHNHNNYYADGSGDYINLNGDILNSLQELQVASGQEAASQELDPYFPATTDLTTTNNLLNATGTPIAGITDDIYGNPRDAATPDIGAVEFDPSPYDLALLDILAPADACGMSANEDVIIRVKNAGSSDISSFTAGYQFLNGSAPVTETVNQTVLAGDTLDYVFTTTADLDMTVLMMDSVFPLQAWVDHPNDPIFQNDSAFTEVNSQYEPPAPTATNYTINYGDSVTITATSADSLYWYESDTATTEIYDGEFFTTPPLFDTTTYYVAARPGGTGGGFIITEICHWRGSSNGAPAAGWPSYLIADDYIEISGAPGADLGGYTLEQWRTGGMDGTHTFAPGTVLSPDGTAIIAVGQLGSSVEDPSNYYYHGNGNFTGLYSSTTTAGRIIKDPNGEIVDAVVYGNMTFPPAAGVTPENWTGSTPAVSSAGNRLEGPYTKDATNWINSGTSPQTPNQMNPGVVPPAGVGDCESPRVPVTVNVIGFPMDDAGVTAFVNPEPTVPSATMQYIDVEVTNFGLNDLTSAEITWALDGSVQNTYNWTGLIPANHKDTIRIDSAVFAGGAYNISAWTSLPNNVPDTINLNDTTSITFSACLNGLYTIGDTAAGSFDFLSFTDALNALEAAGVCGHVTFEVDSGKYNETLTINEIAGADQNNTITFTSMSGDSTHVVLEGNPSSNSEGAILLDGASHFTFSHMTITVNPSASSGRVIQVEGGAHYNKILNCVIDVPPSTTTSYAGVYSTGSLDHHFEFRNNHVKNGYYGVYWRGASTTSHKKGGIFDNNLIEGFNYYGMYFYNNDSLQVTNNTIIGGTDIGFAYGMYAYYTFNGFRFANNEIFMTDPNNSSTKYGMRVGHGNREANMSPGDATGLIYNNMIYLNTDGTQYGLYSYWDNDVKFYYNTVMLTGTGSTTARPLYHANTTANTTGPVFMNNLFIDSVGEYATYVLSPAQISNSDYNNYYSVSSNLAYWGSAQATLSDLQTASGMEANSMNVLPQFMSATDLRLADKQLAGKGIAVPEVTYDIDGNPRGTTITTIGAHETELLQVDIGITDILDIPANVNEFDSLVPRAVVINAGIDTIHTYSIEYTAGNQAPVTYNVVGDTILPMGGTDTVTLPYYSSPAGNYQLCVKTVLATDTNYLNDEHCISIFATPQIDAKVARVAPLASDCQLTNDTITITIENIGVDTIAAGFPVKYLVDGITLESEVVNQAIAPGDSLVYSFNALIDLSVTTFDSTFNVAAWVEVPGDNVQYNDTGYVETLSYHTPVTPLVDNQTLSWGSQAMIIADATAPVFWYLHDTSTVAFHVGDTLMTDLLFADTTFWFQAINGVSGFGEYVGAVDPTIGSTSSSTLTNHYMEFDVLSQSGVNINSVDIFPTSSVGSPFTIELQDASQNVLDTYSGTVAVTGGALQTVDVDFSVPQGSGYRLGFQVNPGLTRNTTGASYPYEIPGEISITGNTFSTSYWYFMYNWNVSSGTGSVGCESPRDFVDITIIHASDDAGITGIWTPDGCSMSMEPVTIDIHNAGTDTIDGGLQAAYRVDNNPFITPENVNLIIAPNDTVSYTFNTLADLSSVLTGDTSYIITAYVDLTGDTLYANDTIVTDTILAEYTPLPPVANDVDGLYGDSVTITATAPDTLLWYENDTIEQHLHMGNYFTTPILYDTTTYWVAAASEGDGGFIITEICHFKTSNGEPVGGWPSYLVADDYIEITGAPNSDLGGYTLEQWRTSSMDGTYTFPQGTYLSPEGTAIIAVGQLGSSVEDPSNFYYHGNGNFSGTYGSATAAGRILKNPFGEIIDAVGYGNYTFPPAAGVTPEDWSGNTPSGSSTSGNRLEGPYTKDATNWINSSVSPQTPNQVNPGVTPPSGTGCVSQRVPLTVNVNVPDANAAITDIIVNEGCNLKADELITIEIANMGGHVIDGNITAAYKVNDGPYITPENMTTVIQPGDTSLYTFNTPANMLAPMGDTAFVIKAYVALAGDTFPHNDTLVSDTIESQYTPDVPVLTDIDIPFGTYGQLQATTNYFVQWYDDPNSPDPIDTGDVFTTPLLYDTTTYYASAAVEGDGGFIITEICHFKTSNGQPVGGWPSYLTADDYIEITGPSNADLGGYTLEQWRAGGMDGTHTFPMGTVLSPEGTAIIAVGQLGSSVEDPSNYYYHGNGNFTGLYSSTTDAGRIIKDPDGNIIDAVVYGNMTFPPAAGVTPQDWTGTTPAVSSSGNRLEGPYTKDATNWVNSGTSPQTPNQINPGVEQPKGVGCESDRIPVTVNVTGAPPIDGQLLAIQNPATGYLKTSQEEVTLLVKNNGTDAFNTVELTYEFNNQPPVTEVINQTVNPGDTIAHTFASTVDMGDFTTYPVKAYIAVPGDTVNLNDTLFAIVENRKDYCDSRATSSTYNYIEHVSVGGIDNHSSGSAQYTDFTDNVAPGIIYPGVNQPIEITWGSTSTFFGSVSVKVYIDVNRDGIFDPVGEAFMAQTIGDDTSNVFSGNINLPANAQSGLTVMRIVLQRTGDLTDIEPCGTYLYGETEDYLVQITPLIPQDAGVVAIQKPSHFMTNANQQFEVVVKNFGSDTLSNVDIEYSFANVNNVYTYSGPIAPQALDTVSMPMITVPTGNHHLCAYTAVPGDSNTFNDGMCKAIYRLHTTSPPYFDDFEGNNYFMRDTSQGKFSTIWELGYPMGQNIVGAHSGGNAWMTGLNRDYESSSTEILYSPTFAITSQGVDSLIFWHNMDAEQGEDGGYVQYRNITGNWSTLGVANDPSAVNWYTDTIIGQAAFSGNTNGWIRSSISIDSANVSNMASITQFRFVFTAGGSSTTGDGWAIDDFRIAIPQSDYDAGVTQINTPADSTVVGDDVAVEVTIRNFGIQTLSQIPVSYRLNNQIPVNETWTGTLAPGAVTSYTFNQSYTAPGGQYNLCAYTELPQDGDHTNDTTCKQVFSTQAALDAGVTDLIVINTPDDAGPDTTWQFRDVTVEVEIHNFGTDELTSMDVEYQRGTLTPVSETWTGSLMPGQSTTYTFSQVFTSPAGNYTLCGRTNLTGDADPSNDELCRALTGVQYQVSVEETSLPGFILHQNQPNPAQNHTVIAYNVPHDGEAQFQITDVLGQTLMTKNMKPSAGKNLLDVNLQNLAPGIYYYSLTFEQHKLVKKMIISK